MGFSLIGKLGGVGRTSPANVTSHKLGQEDVKLLQKHGVKLADDSFKGNAPAMDRINHLLQALKSGDKLSMADAQTLHALKAAHGQPHPMKT
jgi:hypothetical protein